MFLDTETDGIHPGRRVWEVAMIRRDYDGDSVKQMETHFFVGLDLRDSDPFGLRVGGFWDRHPAGRKISGKHAAPSDFVNVLPRHEAAKEIMRWTFDAHIVGAVPSFDTETLAKMLRAEGYMPSWHHHLIDVETMALGWLLGRSNGRQHVIGYDGRTITLKGSHPEPGGGQMHHRAVWKIADSNTQTFEMYGTHHGQKESKVLEITYTRKP